VGSSADLSEDLLLDSVRRRQVSSDQVPNNGLVSISSALYPRYAKELAPIHWVHHRDEHRSEREKCSGRLGKWDNEFTGQVVIDEAQLQKA